MTVLFTPTYFILEEVHSQDEKTEAELSAKCGQMQDYSANPHIDLVRRYWVTQNHKIYNVRCNHQSNLDTCYMERVAFLSKL